jgi:hypothetical protein
MAENDEVVLKIEEPVVEAEPQEAEFSAIEQDAYKEGWRPEKEFEGDKAKWIPADEFMRRKPLFSKIDELKSENYHTRRELQEVKKTLTTLADHHKRVRQVEYDRALKDLQSARKVAMEDRDVDSVVELEEKIDELKDQKRVFEQQLKQETKAQVQPTPEYLTWVKDNPWYMQDQDMHDTADGIAYALIQKANREGRKVAPNEVYAHVNEKMKKAYPEKFAPNREAPNPVDSGSNGTRPSRKSESFRLTAEQEQVARRYEQMGVMTRKEYAEELKKLEDK